MKGLGFRVVGKVLVGVYRDGLTSDRGSGIGDEGMKFSTLGSPRAGAWAASGLRASFEALGLRVSGSGV